jgi:hypothetical protein
VGLNSGWLQWLLTVERIIRQIVTFTLPAFFTCIAGLKTKHYCVKREMLIHLFSEIWYDLGNFVWQYHHCFAVVTLPGVYSSLHPFSYQVVYFLLLNRMGVICTDDVRRVLKTWSWDWVSCAEQHAVACTGTTYVTHNKRISNLVVGLGLCFRALVIIKVALPAYFHCRKLSNTTHSNSLWIKKKICMLFRSLWYGDGKCVKKNISTKANWIRKDWHWRG